MYIYIYIYITPCAPASREREGPRVQPSTRSTPSPPSSFLCYYSRVFSEISNLLYYLSIALFCEFGSDNSRPLAEAESVRGDLFVY